MRQLVWGIVLTGLMGAASSDVQAQARKVQDEANLFSQAAKDRANSMIGVIKSVHKKDLVIETKKTVKRPEGLDAKDDLAVNKFFNEWASNRFKDAGVDGIYVGIVENPPKIRIHVGPNTLKSGMFTVANVQRLEEILIQDLKNKEKDKGLTEGVTYVSDALNRNHKPVANKKAAAPVAAPFNHGAEDGAPNWTSYLCIGLVVLLVAWVVIALIRSFSAPVGGGMGGPAYGGGGYGGGGGGFFSSLMGGMFGAAAGMWMYNNMFGGHSHASDNYGSNAGFGGDASPPSDVGSSGDGYTSGGDYDAGTGGGDWGGGGGGDAGGGDWGGGGGGGGGGGDWGGGGGGDMGGGGGWD